MYSPPKKESTVATERRFAFSGRAHLVDAHSLLRVARLQLRLFLVIFLKDARLDQDVAPQRLISSIITRSQSNRREFDFVSA